MYFYLISYRGVNINHLSWLNQHNRRAEYPSAKWARLAGLPVQAGRLACRGRIAAPAKYGGRVGKSKWDPECGLI